ncbi:nad p h oxidoreductase-related [Anaeramoeba flamelloides]|uniref:Nad p h oxidoreductase-related n=1 Tax=Anaeramoeba flamelloides TaxID=1746091 RepID=A0AAV8AF44_9EUKA|nr:nad p h oxidoreductase-related [Anaeramoeba flamelloides]
MSEKKKILIIYAHPEPKSFNGALLNKAIEIFQNQEHEVKVSDLYEMNFQAVATKKDFTSLKNPEFFKMQLEQRQNNMIDEIKNEQKKVEWADLVIFIFPLWWSGLPAILKGWFDRVFYQWPKLYDQGVFKEKKSLLSVSTGAPRSLYTERGLNGNISKILYSITHGCLYFCGFQVLPTSYHYSVGQSEKIAEECLLSWEERLKNIFDEKSLNFNGLKDYGERGLSQGKKTDLEIIGELL